MAIKTQEAADRLGISVNTVRLWCNEFGKYLSKPGRGGAGKTRKLTDEDLRKLAKVAELRDAGLTYQQVHKALKDGAIADRVPNLPDPDEEAARAKVELAPVTEVQLWQDRYNHALQELERAQGLYLQEVERLTAERDAAHERADSIADEYRERLAELERELGRLQGKLEEIESNRKRGLFGGR